ncbi:competence protein ComFB [Calothrix sp. 336/3]|nr:competence protein ComFB [Calothrix sp. 336/3]
MTKNYRNVMEELIIEEVETQVQRLSPKISKNIKVCEVVAFALNRLPPLYATSKRGWQRQMERGKAELQERITITVRQGITAVVKDPLASGIPLNFEEENAALMAMDKLRNLLQQENLSWDNLAESVEETLLETARGHITWRRGGDEDSFDWESYPQHQM